MAANKCPKCAGDMSNGFIVDSTYGANKVSTWHEGEPERSFFLNTKTHKSKMLKVKTFRCVECGFLESYA